MWRRLLCGLWRAADCGPPPTPRVSFQYLNTILTLSELLSCCKYLLLKYQGTLISALPDQDGRYCDANANLPLRNIHHSYSVALTFNMAVLCIQGLCVPIITAGLNRKLLQCFDTNVLSFAICSYISSDLQ